MGFALAWLAFSLCVVGYAAQSGKGVPFLRWPFALTAAWTAVSALAAAVVVVESLRRAVRGWADWSDEVHFRVVLIAGALCLTLQWACLVAAS
jgi:cell division protein FtsX